MHMQFGGVGNLMDIDRPVFDVKISEAGWNNETEIVLAKPVSSRMPP